MEKWKPQAQNWTVLPVSSSIALLVCMSVYEIVIMQRNVLISCQVDLHDRFL